MRIDLSTVLECSAEAAWAEVQNSALLLRVIRPLAQVIPVDAEKFPDRWIEGAEVRCRSYLFGLIPIGIRTLFFERIDQERFQVQTREHDALIRRWDHLVSIEAQGAHRAIYRDRLQIEAGLLTPLVWAWAYWFYRHRQRQWRLLAKEL